MADKLRSALDWCHHALTEIERLRGEGEHVAALALGVEVALSLAVAAIENEIEDE